MNFLKSLIGMYELEITSADPQTALNSINMAGIQLIDVYAIDDLTVRCKVYRTDIKYIYELLHKMGDRVAIIKYVGLYWRLISLFHRPVLIIGILSLLILTFVLPTRILFVSVEGNVCVSTSAITEGAERYGISFMALRRDIRNEYIKNKLLEEIPQLKWVGVNTFGCVAIISVQERELEQKVEENYGVSSIVAAQDGIISSITVLRGNPLCKVGQAVKAGQILVSGYTDCGLVISVTKADAEVVAQTMRNLDAVSLVNSSKRGDLIEKKQGYTLVFGKKQIKLFKDSGISDARCVKMYERKYLTLPGGFKLPVSLIKEQRIYYENDLNTAEQNDFAWMYDVCENYVNSQMVAGQILQKNQAVSINDELCCLQGKYECLEMIGRVQKEEILNNHGEDS